MARNGKHAAGLPSYFIFPSQGNPCLCSALMVQVPLTGPPHEAMEPKRGGDITANASRITTGSVLLLYFI